MIYYSEVLHGLCTLVEASTMRQARSEMNDEVGRNNVTIIRKATKDDIQHIQAMGGYVPKSARGKK